MELKKMIHGWRVPLGMLMVQVITAGLQLLCRVILVEGTFVFALMAYRHILAALCVLPFALYWEREGLRKFNYLAFFWIFVVALTGISIAMGFFYYGLRDTTATYATNFLNLVPVITFIFSTLLRVEKLGMHTTADKLKVVGTMLCLAGTLITVFYKGISFHLSHHHRNIVNINHSSQNWSRGTMLLLVSCLSYGLWFIVQVQVFNVFPYKYWATMLTCIVGSAQTTVIGLCRDTRPKAWQLGWNLQLITILYSGILGTAATFCLISWAISQRGPTYPSMFNPLTMTLVAIVETLFLGQDISLGRLIGMGVIILGLYAFLWGKHRDSKQTQKVILDYLESQASSTVVPEPFPNSK